MGRFLSGTFPRPWLAIEFTVLFVLLPLMLWFERARFGRMIIPSLLVLAAVFTAILLADSRFDRHRLWNAHALRSGLGHMLRRLIPAALLLTALTWWLRPELFLVLPREHTALWLTVMIAYPLLSVYPQELIFRTFLMHRYRELFGEGRALIWASAASFGLAHVFFANWLAPVLSTAGGWLFARTYSRSKSTLQSSLEHGLWGDVIFTVGLGWYFYGGSIVAP